jgi:outer membrane lipoprotein-sorting protein
MTRVPLLSAQRAWWWSAISGSATAVLAVTGCGQQAPQTPAETATSASGQASGMVRGRYTMIIREEGQELRQEYEVIADGDRRTRINYFGEPEPDWEKRTDGNWMVWDGRVLLDYNPNAEPAHTRIENLDGGQPPVYVFSEGSEHFTRACPDARRLGTHTLLGRTAIRYACAASTADGAMRETHEMSLDQATGLLLKDSSASHTIVASEIEPNATVDADTFSTDLPAGAEDASHPQLEDFRLPRAGGGQVALADYPPPLVIVAGDAAGIRDMLARLLPMTEGGVKPQVIGMLIAIPPADWKGSLLDAADAASFAEEVSKTAGRFPVPVAVDIKGAAGYQITEAAGVEAGQTNPTAVAFLASDGTLAHIRTDAVTDEEIRDLINTLR